MNDHPALSTSQAPSLLPAWRPQLAKACMSCRTPRLLVIPGLNNSGPAHWQTWLQDLSRGSVRVEQADWRHPDIDAWADRIEHTLQAAGPGPWLAVAHSFGVLALSRLIRRRLEARSNGDAPLPLGLQGALLVAPAEPAKFDAADHLPQVHWTVPTTLVASDTDPWMTAASAHLWAQRWGSGYLNLGDAGHINAESGFGPLPLARRWVLAMNQRLTRTARSPCGRHRQ
jgi:uncharacterized protein